MEVAAIVFVGFLVAILLDIDRETHEYLLAARAHRHTGIRARAHALEGGHARVVGSRVLSLEVRGGGDCLENGDVGSYRLSSIVNRGSLAKVRTRVRVRARVCAYADARE